RRYNLDTPLIALVAGLLISNFIRLPEWLQIAFRVEFYIKIGIVLLGASLPLTLLLWGGPIAILQASIISIVTFLVIYRTGRFLELDRRLAAMLAAGGAVCGVSAIAAVAGAVRARREDITVAVAIVVLWALFLIGGLPILARAWFLPAGVAGAWIGSSQFADAAGFAAAQTYGAMLRHGTAHGTPDQVLTAFTLVKVVGRDMWVGVWAFALSLVVATRWNDGGPRQKPSVSDIWSRFPKFIIGFVICMLLVSLAAHGETFRQFNEALRPILVAPIEALRSWAFSFSFLSIGLTSRIKGFGTVTANAFIAFSTGVLINLVLGFLLSAVVFQAHWTHMTP
ncbi:MAG: YeiH family protein, partial [Acetobacteraceae bacterium]